MALPIQERYSLAINCSIIIIYSDSVPHFNNTHKTVSHDEQQSRRLTSDMTITLFNSGPRKPFAWHLGIVGHGIANPRTLFTYYQLFHCNNIQ